MPLTSNSLKALAGLALCAALAAPLAADPAAGAPAPAALSGSASASALSPTVQTYQDFLGGALAALAGPLNDFMVQSGKPSISVVAGGFRELITGERSPFCDHLDRDLTTHLRDDTPYGVPSTRELQDAWIGVGGNKADMNMPYTLSRFGRLLSVDAVVGGDYRIVGSSIFVTVRLLDCRKDSVLWVRSWQMPMAAVDRGDLNTYSDSAPAGYGQQAEVVAPPPPSGTIAPEPEPASPTAGVKVSAASLETGPLGFEQPGVQLESNVHETEFSPYRVNFEAGYESFDPMNSTFRGVVGDLLGPYLNVNWADIVHAEFFLWDRASLPSLPSPIGSLFGYGMTTSLTWPVRLGHYWVVYGGVGGKFEAINVNGGVVNGSPVPNQDTFSFGNNSFFATAGAKVHRGDVGIDANLAYDLLAAYSPYMMVKLGLYYEYTFE
ncbi:MAG TPA: hypothetical protein VK914_06340 [bacterium]|nr:hypothetical protein [bacterium]